MTSTTIINGVAPTRPNMWMLGAGKDILVEGVPGSVAIVNSGQGRATAVETNGNDDVVGAVSELAPGQTLNIAQGKLYRISALASCQLLLGWSP